MKNIICCHCCLFKSKVWRKNGTYILLQTYHFSPVRIVELYHLDNDADFVEKIIALYKNPELMAEMRKNNIKDSAKYSVDIAVKKMAEIYGECVKG